MLITAAYLFMPIWALSESLARGGQTLQKLLIRVKQLAVLLVFKVQGCYLEQVVIRWHLLQKRRVPPWGKGFELERLVDLGHLLHSHVPRYAVDVFAYGLYHFVLKDWGSKIALPQWRCQCFQYRKASMLWGTGCHRFCCRPVSAYRSERMSPHSS